MQGFVKKSYRNRHHSADAGERGKEEILTQQKKGCIASEVLKRDSGLIYEDVLDLDPVIGLERIQEKTVL